MNTKVNPFVYKNYTKIDDEYIRCNLCHSYGTIIKYSVKKGSFNNAENHLAKHHNIHKGKSGLQLSNRKLLDDYEDSEEDPEE